MKLKINVINYCIKILRKITMMQDQKKINNLIKNQNKRFIVNRR